MADRTRRLRIVRLVAGYVAIVAAVPYLTLKILWIAGNPIGFNDKALVTATGLSNAEIAGRLYVSPETVKTHVGNILGKLGARDRTQAVIAAYESGFITRA